MSTFQFRFQTVGTDGAAHAAAQEELTVTTIVNFDADPAGGAFLLAAVAPFSDKELVRATLGPIPTVDENPVRATALVRGPAVSPTWYLEFPIAPIQGFYANGTQQPLQDDYRLSATGPRIPCPVLVLDGAALAVFADGIEGVDVPATLVYRPRFSGTRATLTDTASDPFAAAGTPDYYSWMQGTAFYDDAAGSELELLERLERQIAQGGAEVNLGPAGGADVIVRQCAFAAMDRRGLAWIAPGDVGVSPGQIPPNYASNTAAVFRYHPAAFWTPGKGGELRSIGRVHTNARSIDDAQGAPIILEISARIDASRWLFVIDGTPVTGVIHHPSGSDYRRPRDIWNNVIVPGIRNSQVGGGLALYNDAGLTDTRAKINDLARLSFAHFLEPASTEGTGYVIVLQA